MVCVHNRDTKPMINDLFALQRLVLPYAIVPFTSNSCLQNMEVHNDSGATQWFWYLWYNSSDFDKGFE